jgi:hypothetical protein
MPLHKLLEMKIGVIQKVTQEDLNGCSQHNESFKRQYLEMNGAAADVVDVILITLQSDTECYSLNDSKSSSSSGKWSSCIILHSKENYVQKVLCTHSSPPSGQDKSSNILLLLGNVITYLHTVFPHCIQL